MLEYIAMCVHLSVFVGDSTYIYFYVYLIVLEWTWVLYVKDIIRLIHH